jgi:hypothetical protein
VDGGTRSEQPIVLTEFGGIAFSRNESETWGYSRSDTSSDLLDRYGRLLEAVRSLPALAGFCYTQFSDTYQEANGLLYADRRPKAPFQDIALATSGSAPDRDLTSESVWRERLMERQR